MNKTLGIRLLANRKNSVVIKRNGDVNNRSFQNGDYSRDKKSTSMPNVKTLLSKNKHCHSHCFKKYDNIDLYKQVILNDQDIFAQQKIMPRKYLSIDDCLKRHNKTQSEIVCHSTEKKPNLFASFTKDHNVSTKDQNVSTKDQNASTKNQNTKCKNMTTALFN